MKPGKVDKKVSQMDVLKDIRGLLSSTKEQNSSRETQSDEERALIAEKSKLEEELKDSKELIQKQQLEIDHLRNKINELTAGLNKTNIEKDKSLSKTPEVERLHGETVMLEAKFTELSTALSQINSLLQLRVKDLLRRIARLYQEAGQGDYAIELKRTAGELENAENLARFVQALLNE